MDSLLKYDYITACNQAQHYSLIQNLILNTNHFSSSQVVF